MSVCLPSFRPLSLSNYSLNYSHYLFLSVSILWFFFSITILIYIYLFSVTVYVNNSISVSYLFQYFSFCLYLIYLCLHLIYLCLFLPISLFLFFYLSPTFSLYIYLYLYLPLSLPLSAFLLACLFVSQPACLSVHPRARVPLISASAPEKCLGWSQRWRDRKRNMKGEHNPVCECIKPPRPPASVSDPSAGQLFVSTAACFYRLPCPSPVQLSDYITADLWPPSPLRSRRAALCASSKLSTMTIGVSRLLHWNAVKGSLFTLKWRVLPSTSEVTCLWIREWSAVVRMVSMVGPEAEYWPSPGRE